MSEAQKIEWPGKSGRTYTHWIYPIGASFKAEAGNYVYAKSTPQGWVPCYIGQTNNLQERLGNHEKEPCAKRNGATHVHVHLTATEAARLAEEQDMIARWQPACNEVGVS